MTSKHWWRLFQVTAGLAVLFFAGRKFWRDWDQVQAIPIVWDISLPLILLAIAITLSMYALLITTWRKFLLDWGQRLGGWTAARIWTIANLGKYIPGKVWAIAGLAILAQRQGIAPWSATASAIILQALAIGTGVMVVGVTGTEVLTIKYPWTGPALWILAAISAVCVTLLVSPAVGRWLTRRALRREDVGSPRSTTVLLGILVNLTAWVGYGVAFWLLQQGTIPSAQLSLPAAIGAFTTSYLAGLLFLLAPGGLVVRESILVLMLEGTLGLGAAGALAVASRLMLTLTEIGVAVPFLVLPTERPGAPS
jgi:uncharacterized membrane protein YbhN (UPF0104 family)